MDLLLIEVKAKYKVIRVKHKKVIKMSLSIPMENEILRKILSKIELASQKIIGDKLVKIVLYGSCARGDWGGESDVDIMLLIEDSEDNIKKYDAEITKIVFELSLEYNVLLSVILKNYNQFSKYQEALPFYRNVHTEGIEIYGRKAA